MSDATPSREHAFLQRLVGDWTLDHIAAGNAASTPPSGTELVRAFGGRWIVAEGHTALPDGSTMSSLMTLGYDAARGRVVGSVVASMMDHLWIYDGALDETGETLTLECEGPSYTTPGTTGRYLDTVTVSGDRRELASRYLDANGQWVQFMTHRYRRTAVASP